MSVPRRVMVIGAGPAGAMAAYGLARRGHEVVLLDKVRFPRDKVCGCCINRRALTLLDSQGLMPAIRRLHGKPLERLVLSAGTKCISLRLPLGLSVSRRRLDQSLVDAAIDAGATFIDGVTARVASHDDECALVDIGGNLVEAGLAIVADGLGGRALENLTAFSVKKMQASRMGAALILQSHEAPPLAAGAIRMMCSPVGYVGMVRLEDDRVNLAAAFDAEKVRALGGPGAAACAVLESNGADPSPTMRTSRWRGTPTLTRRRRLAGTRLLVVGDAAGYVEPFTGEGMAWAMCCGHAAVDIAHRAIADWQPGFIDEWNKTHARVVRKHQRVCRLIAGLLRRPAWTRAAIGTLGVAPRLADRMLHRMTRPVRTRSAVAGG